MSVPLTISERTTGSVVVLQLRGNLVADEGDRILLDSVRALAAGGRRAILIDLSEVAYMDSGGVGTLVQLFKEVSAAGGEFKLLHPSPRPAHVLRITHLTTVFEIFEEEPDALRSFRVMPA
jgi:anti-sigma B factor antagonist